MESVVLARVVRGDTVESVHRGHLFIEDCSGKTIYRLGNPEAIAFVRSASKPLQAIPFLTSGAADAFGYSDEEIATACASHSGEKIHVRVVAQMLEKAGLSEAYLRCGVHLPFNDKEAERMIREGEPATQLHNNCSGKHAAMLALAKHVGSDLAAYEQPEHPVQQAIFGVISQFSEIAAGDIAIGIDGCAAPNFAMPVSAMARSFANLIAPPESFDEVTRGACDRIVSSMVRFPELIGGT
ncbi:MAG: asparaginase, partial [Acidobacteriota bacterium]